MAGSCPWSSLASPGCGWPLPPAVSGLVSTQGREAGFLCFFKMFSLLFRYLCLIVLPENVNMCVQLVLSLLRICCLPLVPRGQAHQFRVFRGTVVNMWRRGSGLLFYVSFPEMLSSVLLLLLSLWALAANYEAGREMHIESSRSMQFSKGEASPGPEKWESPMGAGVPQALGLRGLGAGDLELPAPSVIPVAYFLYSSKAKFDTVWVFYFKGHWGPSRALVQGVVGLRGRGCLEMQEGLGVKEEGRSL